MTALFSRNISLWLEGKVSNSGQLQNFRAGGGKGVYVEIKLWLKDKLEHKMTPQFLDLVTNTHTHKY